MPAIPHPPAEPGPEPPAGRPPRPRRFQVGLRTLILLVGAVAVWSTYLIDRGRIDALNRQIARARPLVRELVVEDDRAIAVVKLPELWSNDDRWEIHLPEGRYMLRLATREIAPGGPAPEAKRSPINGGRHVIALDQRQDESAFRIAVLVDGARRIEVEEPMSWHSGTSQGGGDFSQSTTLPAGSPAFLYRRQFLRPDAQGRWNPPTGPTEGILLWIEPEAPDSDP